MGNVASLGVEAKRTLRGILGSRRIQGLELGKKAFFLLRKTSPIRIPEFGQLRRIDNEMMGND